MHFHHRHDIAGCTDHHGDWPDWATTILATLDRMEIQIMTAVQADLDAATAALNGLVAKVGDLEAQLAAQSPALDSTALDAAVAAADAVLNPAPVDVPAPDAPADPAQPADAAGSVPSVPLA